MQGVCLFGKWSSEAPVAESGNGDGNKANRGSIIEESTTVTLELSLAGASGGQCRTGLSV